MIQDKRIMIGPRPITSETMEHIRRQCIYTGLKVIHFDLECEKPYVVVEKQRKSVNQPKKRFIR